MTNKSKEIYIDVSNPFEKDPDGTSSLVYKEDGRYYRVHPMGGAAVELDQNIWEERRAISVTARRKAESILVPDPNPPEPKRKRSARAKKKWRMSKRDLKKLLTE